MKILHLLDTLAMGGKETFVVSLARVQRKGGHEVSLATFDPGNEFAAQLAEAGIPLRQFTRRGPLDLRLASRIRRLVSELGVDLLHCHSENPTLYGALALCFQPGLPLVATIHSGDRDRIPFRHKVEHWVAYLRTDRIVCVAPSLRKHIVEREFAPGRKAVTLFNGVVKPEGGDPEGARSLRRDLGIAEGTLVVTCIGRLQPVKNHLRFLAAFAEALPRLGPAVLVMAGDGPLREETAGRVKALGLEPHVRLLGLRRDVGRILAMSDVYALPSLNEGHSISLLEACSHGKAILASNRGGNPHIISDGISGLLADPENERAMADALVRLGSDPGLRTALGREAENTFTGKFSMDTCAAEYEQVYGEVLEASASRRRG